MTNEVAVIPSIRTLVVGKADITSYQAAVIEEARKRVAEAEASVNEAHAGVIAARDAMEPTQLRIYRYSFTRRTKRLNRERKFLGAVEAGYLPIPRMPAVRLDWMEKAIPPEALTSLAEAKRTGLFEHFGVIDGHDVAGQPQSGVGIPIGRRPRGRDPILVGTILGEPFPLAWWR